MRCCWSSSPRSGLSAKFSALLKGGKPLVILCAVTVLALVMQNLSGSLFVMLWGAHPAYGVLAGSLSFVGGPGTAMAWAKELEAAGLQGAQIVGVGAATLAVIVGALVSGPVTGWIVRSHGLHGREPQPDEVTFAETPRTEAAATAANPTRSRTFWRRSSSSPSPSSSGSASMIYAKDAGILLPGFLSAMIAGVLITNLADLFKYRLDFVPIETRRRHGAAALPRHRPDGDAPRSPWRRSSCRWPSTW